MTREEALERLEGTWSFEVHSGQVMIRETSLIAAVAAIRRERLVHVKTPRPCESRPSSRLPGVAEVGTVGTSVG